MMPDAQSYFDAATRPNRFITAARAFSALSALAPPIMLAALFLEWKYFQQPFWTAADHCFTIGLSASIGFGTVASFLRTIARIQPFAFFARQLTRLASLGVYAGLHYLYGMGFLRSLVTWAAVYFVAGMLIRRIERKTLR
jgi:hypothetical protein